jgi:hypothetical protein
VGYVTILTNVLDKEVWSLACTYIRDKSLVRQAVADVLKQAKEKEGEEDYKKSIAGITKKISNLIQLAEDVTPVKRWEAWADKARLVIDDHEFNPTYAERQLAYTLLFLLRDNGECDGDPLTQHMHL